MPIIYVHGVAVRNQEGMALESRGNQLLERLLEDITWEMVEQHLRRFIAPEIATDADKVLLLHAYWGDLAAKLAWGGASCLPEVVPDPGIEALLRPLIPSRSHLLAELRQPLNQLGARFFGDVFCYLNNRGNASNPGSIPQRILDTLATAQAAKEQTGEPIIVLTNSMGGQILYDIVTHFLPGIPQYANLHIDFWCSVASQVGLFEEMKLFLASSDAYSKDKGNRVPFPDRKHLGIWWNVWDVDDIISYSVRDIIEGVDDTPFRVGKSLMKEHVGYLQEENFYRLFAERIHGMFPAHNAILPLNYR
jgi:hypothetical protein